MVAVRSTDVAGNTDPSPATRSFTVAGPPPALSLLLGTAAVQPVADSVSAGTAEAFAATASASGSVSQVSVYVDVGNTAPTLVVGLYNDDNGHPGTLLAKGTRTGLTALGWNDVTVPRTALQSGERYWIALLGLGNGDLRFRDGVGFSCHSEASRSTTLTTLPAHLADRAGLGLVRRGGQRRRVARGRRPARSSRIRTPNLPRWEGKTCTSGIA